MRGVGGGDGTLNAAAFGVIEAGLPLGILPMGTANDLARTLGIALRISTALPDHRRWQHSPDRSRHRQWRAILQRGERRPFGRACAAIDRRDQAAVRAPRYAFMAMNVLSQARPFRATIVSEDETVNVQTLQIAVGNGRYYGGGNAVEKNATIDDRTSRPLQPRAAAGLETRPHGALVPLRRAWRLGRGAGNPREGVRDAHATPRPVNADGEIVTSTPAHFSIRPGAIMVFAPDGSGSVATA